MTVLTTEITIPDTAIELLITLTDAAELAHHSSVPRHDIIDKLISVDREQLNSMNETFRAWRDQLKNTKHGTERAKADNDGAERNE